MLARCLLKTRLLVSLLVFLAHARTMAKKKAPQANKAAAAVQPTPIPAAGASPASRFAATIAAFCSELPSSSTADEEATCGSFIAEASSLGSAQAIACVRVWWWVWLA